MQARAEVSGCPDPCMSTGREVDFQEKLGCMILLEIITCEDLIPQHLTNGVYISMNSGKRPADHSIAPIRQVFKHPPCFNLVPLWRPSHLPSAIFFLVLNALPKN